MTHLKNILAFSLVTLVVSFINVSCIQEKSEEVTTVNNSKGYTSSLFNIGESLFHENCGMCHLVEKQPVGKALNAFTKSLNKNQLFKLLTDGKAHPVMKISEKEAEALSVFINKREP
ncbi:cytochrome c [Bizionia myxarmorum]|uniref:Cytochrome c n=1 Tax=Bizionia myxarmorum TaxID=291186 RepID=A0A5D0R2N6_9FLAO|nr:cytochrome c [Bizionia myxarmorum]